MDHSSNRRGRVARRLARAAFRLALPSTMALGVLGAGSPAAGAAPLGAAPVPTALHSAPVPTAFYSAPVPTALRSAQPTTALPDATPSGTLVSTDGTTFVQGSSIDFDYTASVTNAENWIGIYQPTDTPGDQASTIWNYTPDASGTDSFSTASLAPGTWVAYLFYDDDYGVMAGPLTFTVTAPPVAAMPSYSTQLDAGRLSGPYGVAVDQAGNVWIADTYGNRVVELSPSGSLERSFGTAGTGPGQLDSPDAIAINGSGHVFVADTGNNRVEEYSSTGTFLATIGGPGTGNGEFAQPERVAVDAAGDLFVADTDNNRVEEFNASTGTYTSSITTGMSDPQGLTVDAAGDLWVADNGITDTSDDSVAEYSSAGVELTSFGSNSSQFGGMSNPAAVAVAAGNVYVSEPDFDFVQEFTVSGIYEGEFGTPSDGAGTLDLPQGLAVTAGGTVYVADSGDNRIAVFAPLTPPTSTPEAPLAVLLPVGAVGAGAAVLVLVARRNRRRSLVAQAR